MQPSILFIIALVLASASIGHGYVHRIKPQLQEAPMQESLVIREPHTFATAANGSSVEEILKELDHSDERSQIQSSCPFTAGAYGGGGGGPFDELVDDCKATIKRIFIRSGNRIDAIQITYILSNGQQYVAGYHGESGGDPHSIDVQTNWGERVVGVHGKTGSKVDRLTFITNWGRIFGPFGGCGGGEFRVDSCQISGIYGRSGAALDSIGFYCRNP